MTPYNRRLNPYIRRMAEDMQVRNLAPATIDAYTFHVDKFCQFFGKSADQLGPEEIRQYQLYLVNEKKASWSSFNQAVCGLRFLYEVTLGKPWAVRHIPFGKRPKKLPTVLSDQEASRLLQCVKNPKHRAVLLTCYAAGLRLSEATHLRIPDIDGQRAQIRITNGKGRKERVVPASPRLLQQLRDPTCPRCDIEMRCIEKQRRPSWKEIFLGEIYSDPAIYSPMHHSRHTGFPAFPHEPYG